MVIPCVGPALYFVDVKVIQYTQQRRLSQDHPMAQSQPRQVPREPEPVPSAPVSSAPVSTDCAILEKNPYPPHGRSLEIPGWRGDGVRNAKQVTFHGGVWIFSGMVHNESELPQSGKSQPGDILNPNPKVSEKSG